MGFIKELLLSHWCRHSVWAVLHSDDAESAGFSISVPSFIQYNLVNLDASSYSMQGRLMGTIR